MNKKIRIAMVILEYHPIIGGAQRQLNLLAPHLKALNVEPFVLTRRYPGLSAFEVVDGVPVYRLPAQGPKATASLIYTAACLRQLARLKPDLVHAYSLFSPLTTSVAYKLLSGIPVVVKVLRGGRLGDVIRLKNKMFGRRRIDIFRRLVDAFIVISQEINTELAELAIDDRKRPYIPNGVDTNHFCPLSYDEKAAIKNALGLPKGPLVIYTGRLVAEKRVDLLLEAWSGLPNIGPDASLVIVGEGDRQETLRSQAVEDVFFVGSVEDVRPYLQAADLFVLPSSTEGLSNSLLEAMAVGLPVIATAVGGAPDLINDGVNGRLVPPKDVEAIRLALIGLLESTECRERLGAAARQTILGNYALPVVARQLRGLYDAVLWGDLPCKNEST